MSNSTRFGHRKIQKPALQRACGWGAGSRTPISSSRDCCPTIRRHPIVDGVDYSTVGVASQIFFEKLPKKSGVASGVAGVTDVVFPPAVENTAFFEVAQVLFDLLVDR